FAGVQGALDSELENARNRQNKPAMFMKTQGEFQKNIEMFRWNVSEMRRLGGRYRRTDNPPEPPAAETAPGPSLRQPRLPRGRKQQKDVKMKKRSHHVIENKGSGGRKSTKRTRLLTERSQISGLGTRDWGLDILFSIGDFGFSNFEFPVSIFEFPFSHFIGRGES
ncbi:MAG: hypothetical protein HYS61_06960, partial [Acidobacteria bacterium]|nr:hypothetical protein [Acidobacteriota bacterium]